VLGCADLHLSLGFLPQTDFGRLADLRLDRSQALQVFLISRMNLAGLLMRRGGVRADEREWSADSRRDMRQIAAVGIDCLVQMLATILCQREVENRFVGIGEKLAQLATVAAIA
jgi:hypothetical protein